MNELLTETSSSTQSGDIWGQLLLAALLVLLVNALIFVPKRLLRSKRLRRGETIPRVRGLIVTDLDEKFVQLEVTPPPQRLVESGLRLAVAAQLPNDTTRQVVPNRPWSPKTPW